MVNRIRTVILDVLYNNEIEFQNSMFKSCILCLDILS